MVYGSGAAKLGHRFAGCETESSFLQGKDPTELNKTNKQADRPRRTSACHALNVRFCNVAFDCLGEKWESIRDDPDRNTKPCDDTVLDFQPSNFTQVLSLRDAISEHEFSLTESEFSTLVATAAQAKAQMLIKDLGGEATWPDCVLGNSYFTFDSCELIKRDPVEPLCEKGWFCNECSKISDEQVHVLYYETHCPYCQVPRDEAGTTLQGFGKTKVKALDNAACWKHWDIFENQDFSLCDLEALYSKPDWHFGIDDLCECFPLEEALSLIHI